jgi:hypothetical protein
MSSLLPVTLLRAHWTTAAFSLRSGNHSEGIDNRKAQTMTTYATASNHAGYCLWCDRPVHMAERNIVETTFGGTRHITVWTHTDTGARECAVGLGQGVLL